MRRTLLGTLELRSTLEPSYCSHALADRPPVDCEPTGNTDEIRDRYGLGRADHYSAIPAIFDDSEVASVAL
jgi:hypothetical protein